MEGFYKWGEGGGWGGIGLDHFCWGIEILVVLVVVVVVVVVEVAVVEVVAVVVLVVVVVEVVLVAVSFSFGIKQFYNKFKPSRNNKSKFNTYCNIATD